MTRRYDDVVVGAGILGLAHAYHLARRGRSVLVAERSPKAQGASVRNFGMLWPIGQPRGERHSLASRSLSHWHDVLARSGIWHDRVGSLHLAYHDDEAQVLREFAERSGVDCEVLDPAEAMARSPAIRREGLKSALFSPTETCVDPREVIASLPAWLASTYGVEFAFGTAVTGYVSPRVMAGGMDVQADRLWVCSGDDLATLFPESFASSGLYPCKLQMMRTSPMDAGWRIGPMLATGLTLRHYPSFESCPTLPALKARFARDLPEFDRFGIHVMTSQNGRGELILGDSHEYGEAIGPFDRPEIDDLVLSYLKTFLDVPHLRIAARWHGVYVKTPDGYYHHSRPAPNVVAVTGVGGAGMTLSFGLADKIVTEELDHA